METEGPSLGKCFQVDSKDVDEYDKVECATQQHPGNHHGDRQCASSY